MSDKVTSKKEHCQFKHPFTCMVAGPTSSGKTVLVRRFLKNFNVCICNLPKPCNILNVLWCHGQWQESYKVPISANVKVTYVEGLPEEDYLISFKPHVIVIDDLMNELGKNEKIANLFTKGSHHQNISIFFIVQNIFHKAPVTRTVSLNSHYFVLMKNPRDRSQIRHLASQTHTGNTKFLVDAYNHATTSPFSYIRVDNTQDTPDNLRVLRRLTPEETANKVFSPIAYIPEDGLQ